MKVIQINNEQNFSMLAPEVPVRQIKTSIGKKPFSQQSSPRDGVRFRNTGLPENLEQLILNDDLKSTIQSVGQKNYQVKTR